MKLPFPFSLHAPFPILKTGTNANIKESPLDDNQGFPSSIGRIDNKVGADVGDNDSGGGGFEGYFDVMKTKTKGGGDEIGSGLDPTVAVDFDYYLDADSGGGVVTDPAADSTMASPGGGGKVRGGRPGLSARGKGRSIRLNN